MVKKLGIWTMAPLMVYAHKLVYGYVEIIYFYRELDVKHQVQGNFGTSLCKHLQQTKIVHKNLLRDYFLLKLTEL